MEKKYLKSACVYQFSLNSVSKRSTSYTRLYRFQTEAPVPADCVALTAFLFANQETDQWRRWDHKSRRGGSDIDQLKLGVYLVFARGGIGMKEPAYKSISFRLQPGAGVRGRTQGGEREKSNNKASKRPDRLYSNCPIKWNELLYIQ